VLRSISVYRHAVVNTPVARWALIARGTAYSNRFPVPSGGGLPHIPARSATTLDFSRPAQRSLAITACRLAESPKRPVCLEGSDGFVTSTAAPIATGWSDPVAGWDSHPLKTNTSHGSRRTGMVSPELSNLAFSGWETIFKDPMTTAAAIDRLVHHSVILELNVPSYRAEQAKKAGQKPSGSANPSKEV